MFLMIPIYIGCSWIDATDYALLYNQPWKYLSGDEFWLGLGGLVVFSFASWCAEPRTMPQQAQMRISPHAINRSLSTLFGIVLTAYAIFLLPMFMHFNLVIALATGSTGAMYELRDTLNQIPGVTSFVSLQSLCVILYVGYPLLTGFKPPRRYRTLLYIMIVACILRAWLWSERIAVLELIMPAVVMKFGMGTTGKKRLLMLAPLFGIFGVFLLFSLGEYFRSWQFYQNSWNGSFLGFAWIRFEGYFATALNNGAMLFNYLAIPYAPINTAAWFYKLPLWPLLGIDISINNVNLVFDNPSLAALLNIYGSMEYNNPGGIFMPFCDYGPVLGMICWLILGFVSGTLLRAFVRRRAIGLVLFPVWYFGVLEILRIFYWSDSRFFPVIVASLFVIRSLKKGLLRGAPNATTAPIPYGLAT
jgi:oligosaccharide repeat unit polymerase